MRNIVEVYMHKYSLQL